MWKKSLLAAAIYAASLTSSAQAQDVETRTTDCLAPNYSTAGRLDWFLGLHPADDVLTAMCRIQSLPGDVRFNVWFPKTNAHRSFDTNFQTDPMTIRDMVQRLQSLLPVSDGPARDENGMAFPKVLENVVQLAANTAPDGTKLGLAPNHPHSNELALWEPVVLRVKPVALAGQEFTLSVFMQPSLGMLALGLQDKATDVRLKGWKGRLDLDGGMFGGKCSAVIPNCKDLPEATEFHTPWVVTEVRLEATGDNMTAAASAIMNHLASNGRNSRLAQKFKNPVLDLASGAGHFSLTDGNATMNMVAEGSPGGTTRISIVWKEGKGQYSVWKALEKAASDFRTISKEAPKGPTVPDSLGKL